MNDPEKVRSGLTIHWVERDAVHAITYLWGLEPIKMELVLKARRLDADAGQSESREEVAAQPVRGRLIGYDAREMWQEFHIAWPQERKDQYLLRQDIKKPLSTDTMVWQSVLEATDALDIPVDRGALSLWGGLGNLTNYLNVQPITAHLFFWTIGITLVSGEFGAGQEEMGYPTLDTLSLPAGSENWTLLGYDVSDPFLLSGLSNCGYLEEERQLLAKQWGEHLNHYHLFSEVEPAVEFKEISDRRVPEHAPFFVYGLYLIAKGLVTEHEEESFV